MARSVPLTTWLFRLGLVSVAYLVTAWLGLGLASVYGNVSPVWPAAGVAAAALLRWGIGLWPGIFVGAMLINLATGIGLPAAIHIAAGNTVEAVAVTLLFRSLSRDVDFTSMRSVMSFITAACCGSLIASMNGASAVILAGEASWAAFSDAAWTWWLGDMLGLIVFTPILCQLPPRLEDRNTVRIIGIASIILSLIAGVIFTASANVISIALSFALIPPVMWMAMRAPRGGGSIATLIIAAISICATGNGLGPFSDYEVTSERMVLLQAFLAVLGMSAMAFAAVATEREQLASELHRRDRLAWLGTMAGGVAHEFNNLGAIILVNAQMLRDRLEDPAMVEHLDRIINMVDRSSAVTRGLLALSREHDFLTEDLKLLDVVRGALAIATADIARADVRIDNQIGDDLWVRADRGATGQILLNLVTNACAALVDQERRVITLTAARHGDDLVRISLCDTGPGISEQLQDEVFAPFFSTKRNSDDEATRRSFTYGLGLSVSRVLAERQQGQLDLTKSLRGAHFVLTLPRGTPSLNQPSDRLRLAEREQRRLLVADDEEELRELLEVALGERGWQVSTVDNGDAAIAAIKANDFDVVILDWQMPRASGREVLDAISDKHPMPRVIVASGWADDLDANEVDGVLPKPYTLTNLNRELRRVLSPDEDSPS